MEIISITLPLFFVFFFISSVFSDTFYYNSSYPCTPPIGCSLLNPFIYHSHKNPEKLLPEATDTIIISSDSPTLFIVNNSLQIQQLQSTTKDTNLIVGNEGKIYFQNILWKGEIQIEGLLVGESVSAEVLSFNNANVTATSIQANLLNDQNSTLAISTLNVTDYYSFGSTLIADSLTVAKNASVSFNFAFTVSNLSIGNHFELNSCVAELACISSTKQNSILSISSSGSISPSSLNFCSNNNNNQIIKLFLDSFSNTSVSGGPVSLVLGNGYLSIPENNQLQVQEIRQIPETNSDIIIAGNLVLIDETTFNSNVYIASSGALSVLNNIKIQTTIKGMCRIGGKGTIISEGNITCPGNLFIGSAFLNVNNFVETDSFTTNYLKANTGVSFSGDLNINTGISLGGTTTVLGGYTQHGGSVEAWICNHTESSPPLLDVYGSIYMANIGFTVSTITYDGNTGYNCKKIPEKILFAQSQSKSISAHQMDVISSPFSSEIEVTEAHIFIQYHNKRIDINDNNIGMWIGILGVALGAAIVGIIFYVRSVRKRRSGYQLVPLE